MSTPENGPTTRDKVRTMTAAGLTTREIANALNLSTQRVNRVKAVLAAIDADKAEQAS